MKKITPSKRTEGVRYAIRDIAVLAGNVAKSGKKMYWLNIGDPSPYGHRTPDWIVSAATASMIEQRNGYAPSFGYDEAVDAIRRRCEDQGFRSIQEIICSTGASEAIEIALTALLDPGDNVLLPYPVYPLYTAVLAKLECEARPYYLHEENGWLPDVGEMEAAIDERTRAMLICTPNNPTGAVYPKELLEEVAEFARRAGILVIADEIYDRLIFEEAEHHSIATLAPDLPVVTCNGLSKNYLVPGWRCGWGIWSGDKDIMGDYVEAAGRLARARLCSNVTAMAAIPAALDGPQTHLPEFLANVKRSRDAAVRCVEQIDEISMVTPTGSFYAFPRLHLDVDDNEWVKGLIAETGVVVVPGGGFGQKPGTAHFRIVILPNETIIEEAFDKIAGYIKKTK